MKIVMNYDDQNARGQESQARVTLSPQDVDRLKAGKSIELVALIGGFESDEMPVKVVINLDTN